MASMRTIGVRLRMDVGRYKQDAKEAAGATDQLGESVNRTGKRGKADLEALGAAAGVAGAGLMGAAGLTIMAAARFDSAMSSVEAATHASVEELDALRQAALDAGAQTAFSATEAAQGIEELAKAGVATSDILSGGLRGALDLAAAGQISVAEAAETAASAMTQFGLRGTDVTHIADLLAAGAGKAQGSVSDMGQALAQSGLVASQTGLTIEETAGALAAFASAGLLGSDAGTSLKTALLRLAAPTGKAGELMDELGINAFDAGGEFVGMAEFAGNLRDALEGMTDQQRQATLATIFGQDAIRAASILYAQGETGIRDWVAAVDDTGFAGETAAIKLDNLKGDIEELTGSLETLAIQGGGGASEGLRVLTQAATGVVNAFGALPPAISGTATVVAGLAGAALLAGAAGQKLNAKVAELSGNLTAMGPGGARAARGLEAVTRWGGRAAGAITAVSIAGTALSLAAGRDMNAQVTALAEGLADFAQGAEPAGETARILGDDLTKLHNALKSLDTGAWSDFERGFVGTLEGITQTGGVFEDSLQKSRERITAIDQALAELVQAGRGDEAAAVFARLAAEGEDFGISTAELNTALPTYAGLLETAARKGEDLAGATGAAADEGRGLIEVWDELHGRALSADEAMLAAKDAVDKVAESFKEGGKSIAGNSRAALENRIAMELAAKEAAEAAQAYLEQGGSAEGAERIMRRFRDATVKATGTTGEARTQVGKLADELFRLPKNKTVNVKVNVDTNIAINAAIDQVGGAIGASLRKLLRRHGGITERLHGGIVEHAQAGLLREAQIFRGGPTMYAFAEPETGGEAFVPKRGDRARGLGILSHAAGWYGATVAPKGAASYGGGMGPQTVEVLVRPDIRSGDRGVMAAITEGMRFDVRTRAGGNVQRHLGPSGQG